MNTNMWTWTDSQLEVTLEKYKIKLEGGYNRKEAINAIKSFEEQGLHKDLKETHNVIEDMKKKDPGLELRKVIFHSIGEQDIPYVFVGHNGRGYYLPKEQPIDVPKYILDSCIKDAVEDRMLPKVHTNGDIEWIIRRVQRFPYSYVD